MLITAIRFRIGNEKFALERRPGLPRFGNTCTALLGSVLTTDCATVLLLGTARGVLLRASKRAGGAGRRHGSVAETCCRQGKRRLCLTVSG